MGNLHWRAVLRDAFALLHGYGTISSVLRFQQTFTL